MDSQPGTLKATIWGAPWLKDPAWWELLDVTGLQSTCAS